MASNDSGATPAAGSARNEAGIAKAQPGPATAPRWSGRTRGGYFGNWFFLQLIRLFGPWPAYVWLVPVAAYFAVASPQAYRCSLDFLQRVFGPQPFWKRPLLVYRHFFSFGMALVDRVAVLTGRGEIQCHVEDAVTVQTTLAQGQGLLLVGSHFGGGEIGGQLLGDTGRPVNLVVLERDEARIRSLFARALEAKRFRVLTTDNHPLRSVPIVAALRRGEIVTLTGDRAFGGADLSVPFLGGTARFPTGPYLLAAFSGAPIFQGFAVREKVGRYRLFSFPPKHVGREVLRAGPEALRPHVAQFAAQLESVARQYPFQWFNLYPFWEDPKAAPVPGSRT